MYDLIIIGGGPAGVAAGIYAARKKIRALLITDIFGGQSVVSDNIQNWVGIKSISGFDFGRMLEEHLRSQEGIEIIDGDKAKKVEKLGEEHYRISTESGQVLETKYLLLATGSHRRRLEVPGGKEFDGRGVAYCATCDAPLFRDKVVAVIGGGNSGLEAVIDLLSYASKIYLLHRREALKGDPVTQEKIRQEPKVEIILNVEVEAIVGDEFVRGLKYKDKNTGLSRTLEVGGVFVEIGSVPNSDLVKDLVKLNQYGEIVVDHWTQLTSDSGIWAAGDVTDGLYKQNNSAAGDAIKAVLNAYDRLTGQNREAKRS